MDLIEAITRRHSVRSYKETPIPAEIVRRLNEEIALCNAEGGLQIQLVTEDPAAFKTLLAHYGNFRGVRNYIALVGPDGFGLDEKLGYYGERLVLLAQQLGLNTCWVGLTYKRTSSVAVAKNQTYGAAIAIGYGTTQGVQHRSKPLAEVAELSGRDPKWYIDGVMSALLAPTAVNQQRFRFSREGNKVSVKAGIGFFSKMDRGIVRYHFEVAAGRENFEWK